MPNYQWCDLELRFLYRIGLHGDCYRWRGQINPDGYGTFGYNGTALLAHRLAYEMAIGPIPQDYTIDHLCYNRWCVRPSHLEAVSRKENSVRAARISPAIRHKKASCIRGHEFTVENTYLHRGKRLCKECRRAHVREYKRNHRQPDHGTCPAA